MVKPPTPGNTAGSGLTAWSRDLLPWIAALDRSLEDGDNPRRALYVDLYRQRGQGGNWSAVLGTGRAPVERRNNWVESNMSRKEDEILSGLRRAMALDEQSHGQDNSDFARDLKNLAQLLKDNNRLEEAEPLMRQALLNYRTRLGVQHQTSQTVLVIYAELLQAMGRSEEQIHAMLRELAPEAFPK